MSDSDCFEVNLRNAKTTEVSEAIMHLKAKSKAIISFHVHSITKTLFGHSLTNGLLLMTLNTGTYF